MPANKHLKKEPRSIEIKSVFSRNSNRVFISAKVAESVQLALSDIKSGRDARIELDKFYESFDVYQDLLKKREILIAKLIEFREGTELYATTVVEIESMFLDERNMRINILELAFLLEKFNDTQINKHLRERFKRGRIADMQKLLPGKLLAQRQAEIAQNKELIDRVAEKLIDNSNEFLIKAQLTNLNYGRKNRFQKALFYYGRGFVSAKASASLYHIGNYAYTYGHFLHMYELFDKAKLLYMEALNEFSKDPRKFKIEIPVVLNNLGSLCKSILDFKSAEQYFRKALKRYNNMAADDDYDFFPDKANVLNNLGILKTDQKDFRASQNAFDEALEINEKLAFEYSDLYISDVAITLNNIGNMKADQDDYAGALQVFKRALTIRKRLAKKDPQSFLSSVAMTLNNIAVLQMDHQKLREAEKSFSEVIMIYNGLAENDPDLYLFSEAMGYYNMGNLHYSNNRFYDAEKNFSKAIQIYNTIPRKDNQTFVNIALTKNCLGMTFTDLYQFQKAENEHLEGINILRNLTRTLPKIFLADLAMSLTNLGDLYRITRNEKALNCYLEAKDIWHHLAKIYPQSYRHERAATLSNLGLLYYEKRETKDSLNNFRQSLRIRKKMVKIASSAYLPGLAETLNNYGLLYLYLNMNRQAIKIFSRTVTIYIELSHSNKEAIFPDLAMALNNLGIAQFRSGKVDSAIISYWKSYYYYRKLARINPELYLDDIVMISVNIAELFQDHLNNQKKSLEFVRLAISGIIKMLSVMELIDSFELAWKIILKWDISPKQFIRENFNMSNKLITLSKKYNFPDVYTEKDNH